MAPARRRQGPADSHRSLMVPPVREAGGIPFRRGEWRGLLGSPGNPAPGYVIRRHLNRHLVAGQDADKVHPQLPGNMGQDNVAIANVHVERGIGKGLGDDSLQFDHIIFRQA